MIKIILTGNVGADVQPKKVGENYVYNLAVATTTGYGDNKKTVWCDVAIWRKDDKLGTITKGTKMLVEGEPSVETWKDKNGDAQGKICIRCVSFEFISSKSEDEQKKVESTQVGSISDGNDGGLPF